MTKKIKSPIGNKLTCKGWHQEAAFRMLQNNLDPDVAEYPDDLIVYGGLGKAARDWESYEKIISEANIMNYDYIADSYSFSFSKAFQLNK